MTKLYCPKGHEQIYLKVRPNYLIEGCKGTIIFCEPCNRPYFDIDCLTQPKKDQPEFCFNEKNKVNSPTLKSSEINKIETKISVNSPTPRLESHVDDINVVETKVNPLEMQWVNPKRESQVAIERVIEALDKLSDFHMFNELKNVLKEINK